MWKCTTDLTEAFRCGQNGAVEVDRCTAGCVPSDGTDDVCQHAPSEELPTSGALDGGASAPMISSDAAPPAKPVDARAMSQMVNVNGGCSASGTTRNGVGALFIFLLGCLWVSGRRTSRGAKIWTPSR